ncbi:MAG: hypothetical protein L3J06_04160 [Cyclobacteriaceae bacterium]|nr:hypothetical protein [Cyclobacteriaceae bacterium]
MPYNTNHINHINYFLQQLITFKVIFDLPAVTFQSTKHCVVDLVEAETIGAQAYIDIFEDDLDAQDSIPIDDETPEDTDTDIPQDTISIDGIIDSVFVNPTTGDIVVVTEDGEEITYEQEVNDETGEPKTTLITDSQGNSWVVNGDGNVSNGNGSISDGTDNTQLAQLEKLLLEILDEFDEEITQWLAVNGKGPLDATEMRWLLNLSECLPEDEDVLTALHKEVIPALKKDLEQVIIYVQNNLTIEYPISEEKKKEIKELVCGHIIPAQSHS